MKSLDRAKSRISAEDRFRRELTWAMLLDTAAALTAVLRRVVVVGAGLPPIDGVRLIADPGPDLNAAFVAGAAELLRDGPGDVLATVADLPTLLPGSVSEFVRAEPARGRLFLRDAAGFGTTMLLARGLPDATQLRPGFEGRSAEQHLRSGAVDPDPGKWADARMDVDTLDDLAAARARGLGSHTREFLAQN